MASKIGVAILGSGIFVKEQHLPAVLASPDLELKALYSRSLKSASDVSTSANLSAVDLYSEDSSKPLSDLLSRSDIHAVIIALPIPNQPAFIKKSLTAGKHVLAEKPIAPDVATARELIQWYHSNVDTRKVFFAIAEQFRYFAAFRTGGEKIAALGKVLNFRIRMQTLIEEGGKYIETPWRKKPNHQGGFLLDGGVHFIAGMRLLLGGGEGKVAKVSAFTAQHQTFLPPVDTADATMKTVGGGNGTFSLSFGTTATGSEWAVACEKGEVFVNPFEGQTVTVKMKGEKEGKEEAAKDGMGGVQKEVFAWAESIRKGKPDDMQSPEEALADLEILESILKSGEREGLPVNLYHQL